MEAIERRISARSFARLLGDWRPPDGRGLADALTDQIRLLVLDGRLGLQTRIPAERELAAALRLSRTTVAAAYEALRAAQVLRSRRGAGSWTQLPPELAGSRAGVAVLPARQRGRRRGRRCSTWRTPRCRPRRPSCAGPPRTPSSTWTRYLGGHGYELVGLPVLRAAIADRFTARGLPTAPDQILVTSGALHAIALALAALVGPGERVLVEHPTYPNVLHALTNVGRPPGAGVDGAGPGRRLGSGADHRRGAGRRAAAGLPDPRLPEPDRRPAGRGRPGSGWSSWPAAPGPRC